MAGLARYVKGPLVPPATIRSARFAASVLQVLTGMIALREAEFCNSYHRCALEHAKVKQIRHQIFPLLYSHVLQVALAAAEGMEAIIALRRALGDSVGAVDALAGAVRCCSKFAFLIVDESLDFEYRLWCIATNLLLVHLQFRYSAFKCENFSDAWVQWTGAVRCCSEQ